MTNVTINWIAKTERAASFEIPEGFEPSDVVAYFEDMGVHQHKHAFLETNSPSDEFHEELGSTNSTQAHDLTEELTSWKVAQNTQIPEPTNSDAMDTMCIAINGYLEDCIAGAINIIRDLNAENGNLQEQIRKMKGLFSDEDGAIAQALEDAGTTAYRAHQFLETVRAAEKAG